jgi:hypothetical protein
VFDKAARTLEAVGLMDMPLRYPVSTGRRWSVHDLSELVYELKPALLYLLLQYSHPWTKKRN